LVFKGFGVVHKAKHCFDDCEYAVKMIRFRFKSDTDFKKITREVQLYANLSSHPNLVAYKTAWLENWCLHQQKLPFSEQMGTQDQEILSQTQISSKTSNINEDDVSIRFEESSKSGIRIERSKTKITQTDYCSISTKRIDIEEVSYEEDIEDENEMSCNSDPGYSAFLRSSDDPMSACEAKTIGRKKTISMSSTKSQSDSAIEYNHCFEVEKYQKPVIPEINVTNFDGNRCPFACNSFGAVLYIQMELCGKNLKTWLRERNDQIIANYKKSYQTVSSSDDMLSYIDSKMSLNIFRMVLKGVEFIHSQHLIHRDLKPQNILFSIDETKVKIGDFGLATLHNSIDNEEISLHNYKQSKCTKAEAHNHTGGIGTSIYAAPEQKAGKNYDNRADLYSLGIILFELFYPLSTDMEKNKCVTDITKNRILPKKFQNRWPIVAEMILKLTDSRPLSRPHASDILQSSLFLGKEQQMIKSLEEKLQSVESESGRKDKELDALRTLLMIREQEIENLKLQLERMSTKKYKDL
jgi:serine/threonine protein kinase